MISELDWPVTRRKPATMSPGVMMQINCPAAYGTFVPYLTVDAPGSEA